MQATGNTGAFIKKDVYSQPSGRNPRLKGKGKSPLSESMKYEMAKKKAPVAKKAPAPVKKASKGPIDSLIDAGRRKIKDTNAEVTRLHREKIDRHVEGRASRRK
jgi:hypothetical protein